MTSFDDLVADVQREAGQLSTGGRRLKAADVERAAAKIRVSTITIELLEAAIVAALNLPPLHRLLLALALRRAVGAAKHLEHCEAPLSKLASDSIYALRELQLFPLRLRLLDEVIEAAHPLIPSAELYFQRANTRRAITAADGAATELVFADLDTAIRRARAEGNAGLCAIATAAWVKSIVETVAGGGTGLEHRLAEAESAIADTLELPLEPIDRATVHQARAHLLRLRTPEESLTALEAALALLPPGEPFWIELAADLVATLRRVKRLDEAVKRGTDYLDRIQSDRRGIEVAMLLLALGEALFAGARWGEARRRFEEGLQLVRGRDPINEALARLHLARLGLSTGDSVLSEQHLGFLRDHRGELDPLARQDLDLLEAAAHAARGETGQQRELLARTRSTSRQDRVRVEVSLELARLELSEGRPVPDLDALVVAGLEADLDERHEAVLADLLGNHGGALAPATRDEALRWARRRRQSLVARLEHQAGQTGAARATLRAALAGELDERERLGCTHLLMTLLDEEEHAERRTLCDELDRLLGVVEDVPNIRLDLAAGLSLTAGDELSVVLRARAHARRALKAPLSPREREFGHRTLARSTVELLRLSLPLSSPSLAQETSCLLEELALVEQEASELRLAATSLLLLPGPLTHPDALSVAGRLLGLVTAPPDARGLGALVERLRWVRDRVTAPAAPTRAELRGPFDELPNWLVDHVHGRGGTVAPDELAQAALALAAVARARPDVADSLLAMAISVQHKVPRGLRQELLDAVYSVVQSADEVGSARWPRLREALDGVRKKHRHPVLANILAATRRSSSAEPREPPTRQAMASWRKQIANTPGGGRQRARDCFEQGVALMKSLQLDPHAADAGLRASEARALLGEAVDIARTKHLPELFDLLVSHGNAWKLSPDEDVEKALRIYESAAKLDAVPEQEAKLWKVQADALRSRGTDDDLRRADQLLERSCRVRHGRLLAEALMSRARVALVHPDLDEAARERGAANFVMDAVRTDRGFGDQAGVVGFLLHRLSAWERMQPNDPTPARLRDELKTICPARAAQLDAPVPRVSGREVESVVAMMRHPAGEAFWKVRTRLMPASKRGLDPLGLLDRFGPSVKESIREQSERDTLVGRPDQAAEVLASLAAVPNDDDARPGKLAARVVLLAYLARSGRRTVSEVRSATNEAIDALGHVEDLLVRSTLLREVAVVWSPDDHTDDPVRDFARSADLLRRCVEMEGGEDNAVGDTLAFLARALRYSPVGDLQSNLREARRLYQLCLVRARAADGPDVIANLVHNLADVENQMGTGSRLERLRAAELRLQEAASTAQSPHKKAQYMANLAWERTQIGALIGGAEGRRFLEKSLATFDEVDAALLNEHERRNIEGNRCVCEATLARLAGGRGAEITWWREHLAKLDARTAPYAIATAKHNLGNALMFGGDVTGEELAEGLRLSREAAEVRTLKANPRHHWETSLNIGGALLGALASERGDLLPIPQGQAAAEAGSWLRRAAAAARTLGPGEELLEAAFALSALAAGGPTPERFIEDAEEAWRFVREASAYLLLHKQSREGEARAATGIAAQLAYRLAERSFPVASRGLSFVLRGGSAQLVERWIVRSQQPARRPLRARLSRPEAVSAAAWDAWLNALGSRDQRQMADALDRVRDVAPAFLAEDHANDVTWRWLAARPGSVAVALVFAEPASLALVMQVDGTGERKTWVLGLELEPPPRPLDGLPGLMRGSAPEASAHAALDVLAQWLRRGVVEPIERFLGAPPSAVLWSPDPLLRLVPPSAVWRTVPVAAVTSLVLPDLTSSPGRRRSSLVVLADPGAETRLDLRGQGVPTLNALETAAARRGPVRLLASVGGRFGRTLLGERSGVRDTPASGRDVMLEAAEHEVIILVAHGEVETLEDAAVICLDSSGSVDRLDVAQLGRSPDAFAGATVLLLSCDGGRMGDSLIEPGGLAGTLLSAGAACVVAPLWPVRLDAARQVGEAVLEGLASGDEPWAVLAKLQLHAHGDSPALGRPAPSLSERRAELALQRLAFVAWVG